MAKMVAERRMALYWTIAQINGNSTQLGSSIMNNFGEFDAFFIRPETTFEFWQFIAFALLTGNH